MHVALLSNEYPPFIFGGIGTFVKSLAHGLSKNGVKVTVISGCPTSKKYLLGNRMSEENDSGIQVLRYPYPNIPPRHTMFQLANIEKLQKDIHNLDVDVIHGQSGSTFPSLLKLQNMAPIVVTFHTSPQVEKFISCYSLNRGGSLKDFWTYVLGYPLWDYTFREELRNSNLAIAVSKSVKSDLLTEMGENYSGKIHDIHNGIDIEMLDKEYADTPQNIEESDKKILFAGRMFWRKGVSNLVNLAYLMQKEGLDYNIIAHGDGPLLGAMKHRIRSLGLTNIDLKGFTSKAQLMRSMKCCRFVVIPSFYEACPMVLLESMCLGKIPIMFNLPFAYEFTENGQYGLLSKDLRSLVQQLKTASVDSDLQTLGGKVKHFARGKYDIKHVSLSYLKAYSEVCAH